VTFHNGNRGYNDPNIAKGFDSLGKALAPPKLEDLYYGAKAAETRQKTQNLGDLYRQAQDPNFNQDTFDRSGAAAGAWNPSQGYHALDQKDATDRRGQDIVSGDKRYVAGVESGDRRYNTDRTELTRMYDINTTDKRGRDIAQQHEGAETTRTMLAPVAKDATRFVPPQVASLYGVPEKQIGVIAAQPGVKNLLPTGEVFEGNKKPMSETEMRGAILGGMPRSQQEAVAFANTPVETVPGPDGVGVPKTRPEVLAGGVAPVDRTHAPQVFNYLTPEGKTGSAVYDNGSKGLVDSQTRQPLPVGIKVQAPTGVQNSGGLGPTTANSTEANRKAANLDVMDQTLNAYEDLLKKNPGVVGIPGAVQGAAQNAVSVAQEFAGAFGNLDPNVKLGEDQVRQLAAKVGAASRNPAIAQARVLEADLAYKWAQLQNPSGEVSRQAFERGLEVVTGGTALRNNDSALESLTQMREAVKRERGGVNSLRAPANTPTPAPGETPTAPAAPAAPKTIQTPAGTVTITPVE
jgi:hypothetical protein